MPEGQLKNGIGIARDMATRARATGLSHGAYVSTLIDGAPWPSITKRR